MSKYKRRKEDSSSSEGDSDDSVEQVRKKDIKERDEFADRLKNRDKEKTRNVARPNAGTSGKSCQKMLIII